MAPERVERALHLPGLPARTRRDLNRTGWELDMKLNFLIFQEGNKFFLLQPVINGDLWRFPKASTGVNH